MAGSSTPLVLVVLCAIVTLDCVSTLPRDITFKQVDENLVENSEPAPPSSPAINELQKMPEQEYKPTKSCFHFFVSRNMSSLLAEATKMLRTIRDRREREWILTFIYRIKSLAEHLRSHPDSRNYDCLPSDDDEARKRILSDDSLRQQPELYFVDEVPRRSSDVELVPDKGDDVSRQSGDIVELVSDNKREDVSGQSSDTELVPDKGGDVPSDVEGKEQDPSAKDNQESNNPPVEEQSIPTVPSMPDAVGTSEGKDSVSPPLKPESQNSTEYPLSISDASKPDVTVSGQGPQSQVTGEGKDVPDKKERPLDNALVLSVVPDCDSIAECEKRQQSQSSDVPRDAYFAEGNIYPAYQSDEAREQDLNAEEMYRQEVLKERIRKALLEELAPEIRKFKTVGGTEEDLLNLWTYVKDDKSAEENGMDFDYEETGAAAGDLNLNEKVQPDRTVAPSLDEVQSSKESSNAVKDSSYEPYDDSDVLVQQLFDVRFDNPPSKTTKSLSDQNNEYLVTSSQPPF